METGPKYKPSNSVLISIELDCTFEGDLAIKSLQLNNWSHLHYLSLSKRKITQERIKLVTKASSISHLQDSNISKACF